MRTLLASLVYFAFSACSHAAVPAATETLIVSVGSDAGSNVVARLTAAGFAMGSGSSLQTGVLIGTAPEAAFGRLRAIEGVIAVERPVPVDIGPPGSDQ